MHDFLYEAYYVDRIRRPKVLAYDDACHLAKFFLNRIGKSAFVDWLFAPDPETGHILRVVCDRFHFPNHTDKWCIKNVDPSKCKVPGFEKSNTEAGEEGFSWLCHAKHVLQNMNEAHFNFFTLRLIHLRNHDLCTRVRASAGQSEQASS